jgi:CRP/FNR family transcriptional regulator, anaerobic regulatory protein
MPTSTGYPLHRSEIYDELERGDLNILRAMLPSERLFDRGESILIGGEPHDYVYRIRTGWAARVRHIEDGRRQLITIFLPGDLCAVKCLLMNRQPDAIECVTPVTAHFIQQAELRTLARLDPDVALRLMFQLGEDERRLHNWVAVLGRGDADEAMATLMLDLRARLRLVGLANGNTFKLPMTQQQIGEHLGLTVVHVNRVLRRFRESGVLTVTKSIVTVHSSQKLRQLASPMLDVFEKTSPAYNSD